MNKKEALDYMYGVAICSSGVGETGDKVRECYNIIAEALEENQKQKEILEILKPFFKGAIFPSYLYFEFPNDVFEKIKETFDNE